MNEWHSIKADFFNRFQLSRRSNYRSSVASSINILYHLSSAFECEIQWKPIHTRPLFEMQFSFLSIQRSCVWPNAHALTIFVFVLPQYLFIDSQNNIGFRASMSSQIFMRPDFGRCCLCANWTKNEHSNNDAHTTNISLSFHSDSLEFRCAFYKYLYSTSEPSMNFTFTVWKKFHRKNDRFQREIIYWHFVSPHSKQMNEIPASSIPSLHKNIVFFSYENSSFD